MSVKYFDLKKRKTNFRKFALTYSAFFFNFSIHFYSQGWKNLEFKNKNQNFPGDSVDKNQTDNAGGTGSNPGPGRFHMPQSNNY